MEDLEIKLDEYDTLGCSKEGLLLRRGSIISLSISNLLNYGIADLTKDEAKQLSEWLIKASEEK